MPRLIGRAVLCPATPQHKYISFVFEIVYDVPARQSLASFGAGVCCEHRNGQLSLRGLSPKPDEKARIITFVERPGSVGGGAGSARPAVSDRSVVHGPRTHRGPRSARGHTLATPPSACDDSPSFPNASAFSIRGGVGCRRAPQYGVLACSDGGHRHLTERPGRSHALRRETRRNLTDSGNFAAMHLSIAFTLRA